jgi:putative membrane protein
MDVLFYLLLFVHFIGLMLIATAFLALVGMMPRTAGDAPVSTNTYLTRLGHVGIVLSLVSGPLLVFVRYGGFSGISPWFHVKMLCLVVLIVGIVIAARSSRRLRNGDATALRGVRLGRIVAAVALFGVVLAAVLAFG